MYKIKYKILNFLCKLFRIKRKFYLEPFIYIDEYGNHVEMSTTIKWLDKKTKLAFTEEDAIREWNIYLFLKYDYLGDWIYYF